MCRRIAAGGRAGGRLNFHQVPQEGEISGGGVETSDSPCREGEEPDQISIAGV